MNATAELPAPSTSALLQGSRTLQRPLHFDGPDYSPEQDQERLTGQVRRVYACMASGQWLTLRQIAALTGDPEASVSAQLRHLRKPRFGGHRVEKNYLGRGLYEYRLIVSTPAPTHAD